ncbi:MAG: hypothetical protein U0836_14395 [Pirellulales bacterium]
MAIASSLLIVTILSTAPNVERPAGAEAVFECDFGEDWDRNYDLWPDGWERKRGLGFPAYVPCKIFPEDPQANRELTMQLNGAGALAQSPQAPIDPAFAYVLQVRVKTTAVRAGHAFVSIEFRGPAHGKSPGEVLAHHDSQFVRNEEWTTCVVGPVTPPENATTAVIGLHLTPADSTELSGTASFADVWLGRLPRIELDTGSLHNIFTDRERVQVRCRISGLRTLTSVAFQLEDVNGKTLAEAEQPLRRDAPLVMPVSAREHGRPSEFSAMSATWRPPLERVGFYRVRATVQNEERGSYGRELTLVLAAPARAPQQGEFGWVLQSIEAPLPADALSSVLRQAGINWVKAPAWRHERKGEHLEALARLAERLGRERIEVVAVLDEPPPELRPHLADADHPVAADMFSTPTELWYPSLEPTLARLALKIHWWQLGTDDDASFVGYPEMAATLKRVQTALGRFGQHLNVGVAWRYLAGPPSADSSQFITLSAGPALTADELNAYLPTSAPAGVARWALLDALPPSEYELPERIADLVQCMAAARRSGAEGVFMRRPFDRQRGLMQPDGSPGELFLPWRTTALALAGKQAAGQLHLQGGSQNEVFGAEGEAVAVVWRAQPGEESAYLGESPMQRDVWGHEQPTARDPAGNHRFTVGPVPTLLSGLDEPLVRWQIGVQLEPAQLPSVVRRPQRVSLRLTNPFPQGIVGSVRVIAPPQWIVQPDTREFQLQAGETQSLPLDVRLPADVTLGEHPLQFDVQLSAARRYEFRMHRSLSVGADELRIEAYTRLTADGDLEVEQHIVSSADRPLGLECFLYAPERKRVRSFVRVREGEDVRTYRLPNGAELIGKQLWLRAEEQHGDRVFNVRFLAR